MRDEITGQGGGGTNIVPRKRTASTSPAQMPSKKALISNGGGGSFVGGASPLSSTRGIGHGLALRSVTGPGSSAESSLADKEGVEKRVVGAEEAEGELEALEFPSNLAGWVDRLPQDLLAVIDIIEKEGGGASWLVRCLFCFYRQEMRTGPSSTFPLLTLPDENCERRYQPYRPEKGKLSSSRPCSARMQNVVCACERQCDSGARF